MGSYIPLKFSWYEQEHVTQQKTLLRNRRKLGPSHGVTWAWQTLSVNAVTFTSLSTQAGTGREGHEKGWWEIWCAGDAEVLENPGLQLKERPNLKQCLEVFLGRFQSSHSGTFWANPTQFPLPPPSASFIPLTELTATHSARSLRIIDQFTSSYYFGCFTLHITLVPQWSNFKDSLVVCLSVRLEMENACKLMQNI